MAQQVINVGTAANSGGGDALRDAMIKVNENFTELYDLVEGDAGPIIRGADGTLLVDGTNSTLNAEALTGVAPSGVVTWPNISNTPDSIAEYGILDAYTKAQTDQKINLATLGLTDGVTDFKGSIFGDDSTLLVDGVNGTIVGEIDTANGSISNITTTNLYAANSSGINLTANGFNNLVVKQTEVLVQNVPLRVGAGVEEAFATLTGATGTVTHNCDNGHIFYHTTPAADWTANFTNLSLTVEHATTLSIVISQGATAYIPSAVEIGGVAQTLLWQGGSQPSGTADGTDVVAFSILNDGGTYVVMGQLVGFS